MLVKGNDELMPSMVINVSNLIMQGDCSVFQNVSLMSYVYLTLPINARSKAMLTATQVQAFGYIM